VKAGVLVAFMLSNLRGVIEMEELRAKLSELNERINGIMERL
jgi:hypothetical protein